MANKIELVPNRRAQDVVPATSRYADSQVLYYTVGDITYITFNTYKKTPIEETSRDHFATIPPGMAYRPDLVSNDSYGTPDFWWKIMEANNIKDIYEFKAGITIRIPNNIFG